MVVPVSRSARSWSQRLTRFWGSRPVVGSSRNSTCGRCTTPPQGERSMVTTSPCFRAGCVSSRPFELGGHHPLSEDAEVATGGPGRRGGQAERRPEIQRCHRQRAHIEERIKEAKNAAA